MMIVAANKVVSFHYILKNASDEELENNREGEPMSYLHGAGSVIRGLEQAMAGRAAGERFTVTVQPEDAYGTRTDANIQRIPLKRLGKIPRPRAGQILMLQTNQGPARVRVVKVGRFNIDVDANHPLSGHILTFDVEIASVRDASDEEISHGHAHGPGGHEHG